MFQQIDSFINWIQNFDYSLLQNEADVETKFVIKLFEHLDYSDSLRRDKFQVPVYQPLSQKKRGKKPEADYVYFSETDPLKQTEDTSLVVIEVKRPEETLKAALLQAQYYAYFLKTPFLVLSNGYNLQIWKHREYQADEKVFDVTLDELRTERIAEELYQLLNYAVVKQLKKDLFSETTHAMYVHLISALRQYPNLQHLLQLSDFRPSVYTKGNLYVVEQPKVKISCELPVFLKKGSCQIEFSNIMLRGLAVYLSHQDIVNNLLVGLNTIPSCKTRPFITKQTTDSFEVILGQSIVQLNIDEVNDLCTCIDTVGEKYQNILTETAGVIHDKR